jgi:hypothetical protein
MAFQTNRRQIRFLAADFLSEAIEEFLESGSKEKKIGSCVVKVAVATELLLKEKLESICPALILEEIDDKALQVAKLYALDKKMRNPKELENVIIKTASFRKLLSRAGKFFDLSNAKDDLDKLHKVRNALIHHRSKIDVAEVNILLIERIFPFLEEFSRGDSVARLKLRPEVWTRLKQMAQSSADALVTEVRKKIAHSSSLADRLPPDRISILLRRAPEEYDGEELVAQALQCPACKQSSVSAFSGWDVDKDEDGFVFGGWEVRMHCRVCDLELQSIHIEQVARNFESFFDSANDSEKKKWLEVLEAPAPNDSGF